MNNTIAEPEVIRCVCSKKIYQNGKIHSRMVHVEQQKALCPQCKRMVPVPIKSLSASSAEYVQRYTEFLRTHYEERDAR